MLLQTTQDTVQAVVATPAGATAPAPAAAPSVSVFTAFTDTDPTAIGLTPTQGNSNLVLASPTTLAVVTSPGTGKTRTVNFFSAVNLDDANPVAVTVNLVNSLGVATTLKNAVTLLPGETLQYGLNVGFQVLDASGFLKISGSESAAEEAAEALGAPSVSALLLMQNKLLVRLLKGDTAVSEEDMLNELTDPDFLTVIEPLTV